MIDNPLVGELRLDLSRLPLGETSGSRIGMLTAADQRTAERLVELDRLVADEPAVWTRDKETSTAQEELAEVG